MYRRYIGLTRLVCRRIGGHAFRDEQMKLTIGRGKPCLTRGRLSRMSGLFAGQFRGGQPDLQESNISYIKQEQCNEAHIGYVYLAGLFKTDLAVTLTMNNFPCDISIMAIRKRSFDLRKSLIK